MLNSETYVSNVYAVSWSKSVNDGTAEAASVAVVNARRDFMVTMCKWFCRIMAVLRGQTRRKMSKWLQKSKSREEPQGAMSNHTGLRARLLASSSNHRQQ